MRRDLAQPVGGVEDQQLAQGGRRIGAVAQRRRPICQSIAVSCAVLRSLGAPRAVRMRSGERRVVGPDDLSALADGHRGVVIEAL